LLLGVLGALLAGVLILFGFGQALGARGHAQRAADLAAVSAAQVHRYGTELDLGPPAAFGWLEANSRRFVAAATEMLVSSED
jgi:hypothetical protein